MIDVVCGVLKGDDGKYLVAKRAPDKSYPLCWEFPGGKVERGESHVQALVREFEEEVGVLTAVIDDEPIMSSVFPHSSHPPGFRVTMYHLRCAEHAPQVRLSKEHVEARWVTLDEAVALARHEQIAPSFPMCVKALGGAL